MKYPLAPSPINLALILETLVILICLSNAAGIKISHSHSKRLNGSDSITYNIIKTIKYSHYTFPPLNPAKLPVFTL